MTLSGTEIEKMYQYVLTHGTNKMYSVGKALPILESSIGYRRWISTKGAEKYDVADINLF